MPKQIIILDGVPEACKVSPGHQDAGIITVREAWVYLRADRHLEMLACTFWVAIAMSTHTNVAPGNDTVTRFIFIPLKSIDLLAQDPT